MRNYPIRENFDNYYLNFSNVTFSNKNINFYGNLNQKQEKIVNKSISVIDKIISISSIDRFYDRYDENQLLDPEKLENFEVLFNSNNFSYCNLPNNYKHVKYIKLLECSLPSFVNSVPYLTLKIKEIDNNFCGSNNSLNDISALLIPDREINKKMYCKNYGQNYSTLEFKPYGKLDKMTLQFCCPDNELFDFNMNDTNGYWTNVSDFNNRRLSLLERDKDSDLDAGLLEVLDNNGTGREFKNSFSANDQVIINNSTNEYRFKISSVATNEEKTITDKITSINSSKNIDLEIGAHSLIVGDEITIVSIVTATIGGQAKSGCIGTFEIIAGAASATKVRLTTNVGSNFTADADTGGDIVFKIKNRYNLNFSNTQYDTSYVLVSPIVNQLTTAGGNKELQFTISAHGLVNTDKIEIYSIGADTVGGISRSELLGLGLQSITTIDVNNFKITISALSSNFTAESTAGGKVVVRLFGSFSNIITDSIMDTFTKTVDGSGLNTKLIKNITKSGPSFQQIMLIFQIGIINSTLDPKSINKISS